MINTMNLRKIIIDLAIQGKLTEQTQEEGYAEDLFNQVQRRRDELVKIGKVKKEKTFPDISGEETPFKIPENWKWVRLIDIATIINGDRGKNYPAKSTLSREGIPFISALNLNGRDVDDDERLLCLSEEQYRKLGSGKLQKNDIVICIRGSLGKHGRYPFEKGAIASSLVICRPYDFEDIIGDYIMIWLDSSMFPLEIDKYDGGSAQPNLAAENLKKFLVPLPPIEEQKRILYKVGEMCEYVDNIDSLQSHYFFNQEVLKNKLIEAAIRGKLTEQLPEDGSAEDLYKQIQEEKDALISQKKIKNEKPLTAISAEEIPFEIPHNWKWVRLNDISYRIWAGGDKPSDFSEEMDEDRTVPVVANGGSNEGILGYTKTATAKKNTITVAGRGTIGFTVYRKYDYCPIVRLIVVEQSQYIEPRYLQIFLQSMPEASVGSSIPQLTVPMIKPKLVSLPPLKEQIRIADRLTELIDTMSER